MFEKLFRDHQLMESASTSHKKFVCTQEGVIEILTGHSARSAEVKEGDIFTVTAKHRLGYEGVLTTKGAWSHQPGFSGMKTNPVAAAYKFTCLLRDENIGGNDSFFAQFEEFMVGAKHEDFEEMSEEMSIEQVKAELPNIKVRYHGKLEDARVAGRKNKFASVYLLRSPLMQAMEFSWEAVARAVNSGKPLIAEDFEDEHGINAGSRIKKKGKKIYETVQIKPSETRWYRQSKEFGRPADKKVGRGKLQYTKKVR